MVGRSDRGKWRLVIGPDQEETRRENERWQGNFIVLTCMPSVK